MGVRLKFGLNRPIFRRRQPKFFWIFYFLISSADRRRDKNFKSTWREFFLRKSIKMKWERDSIDDEVPEIRQSVSSLTSVQVFIRVRPSWGGFQVVDYARRIGSSESKRESESACKESPLKFDTASGAILTGQDKTFYFDRIFLDDVSQKFLYNEAISGMVGDFFQGYNCTVFTYGQTGSGKTHTMGTEGVEKGREEIMGIIPRVVNEVFALVSSEEDGGCCDGAVDDSESDGEYSDDFSFDGNDKNKNKKKDNNSDSDGGWNHEIKIGFLEIYNEEIRDLLHPEIQSRDIHIRENVNNEIIVQGAEHVSTTNPAETLALLERGCVNRTTAATNVHSKSSRSHAIFTLMLDKTRRRANVDHPAIIDDGDDNNSSININNNNNNNNHVIEFVRSKFHLVDLAGSERAKRTGAVGDRFKESVRINQGLLGLGKVIRALSVMKGNNNNGRSKHVPYRESKLTRFLQDSLGGNSRTTMIACISPDPVDMTEGINTLAYAAHARNIRNKPKITFSKIIESIDMSKNIETEVELRKEIETLKNILADKEARDRPPPPPPERMSISIQGGEGASKVLQAQVQNITGQLVNSRFIMAEAKLKLEGVLNWVRGGVWQHGQSNEDALLQKLVAVGDLLMDERENISPSPNLAARERHEQQKLLEARNEIIDLKKQVNEYEQDLLRDEEIFAAKSRDTKIIQKQLHRETVKSAKLEERVVQLERELEEKKMKEVEKKRKEEEKEGEKQRIEEDEGNAADTNSTPVKGMTNFVTLTEQRTKLTEFVQHLNNKFHFNQRQRDQAIERNKSEIKAKENVIVTLQRSRMDAVRLMQRYEDRKTDLTQRINKMRLSDERDSGSNNCSFNWNFEECEEELQSLNDQIRDQQRIVSLQKQSAKKITELNLEVDCSKRKVSELESERKKDESTYSKEKGNLVDRIKQIEDEMGMSGRDGFLPQPQSGSPQPPPQSKDDEKENRSVKEDEKMLFLLEKCSEQEELIERMRREGWAGMTAKTTPARKKTKIKASMLREIDFVGIPPPPPTPQNLAR